jgi:hypothetical protein
MTIAGLSDSDGGDRMRAAVYYDKQDIKIEDVPVPHCHDNEVLVKVTFIFLFVLSSRANALAT